MERLECSAVCETQLQSIFKHALQLYRSGLAVKTCKHPSCFHKIRIPMEITVKDNDIIFNTPGLLPLPFLLRLMQLHLLQKSFAALELLLFLVTVKFPSYTSPAWAKDLLDFHSPLRLFYYKIRIRGTLAPFDVKSRNDRGYVGANFMHHRMIDCE